MDIASNLVEAGNRRVAETGIANCRFYGPTMNAFDAAEKNGRAADLQREMEDLFISQSQSPDKDTTSIPATFLLVTMEV